MLRLRSAAGFALQGVACARQRAVLALLGVAVGVAALVALLSLGRGFERQALEEFRTLGMQVLSVSLVPGPDGPAVPGRRRPDAEALLAALAALPEVEQASEVAVLACPGSGEPLPSLTAVRPGLAHILGLRMAAGRFLHGLDGPAPRVVLGAQAAQQLRRAGLGAAPGMELSLCGRVWQVAGVLAPMTLAESVVPVALDQGLLVSTAAGRRIEPHAAPDQFVLRLRPAVSPIAFEPRLTAWLGERTGQQAQVTSARRMLELRHSQAARLTRFLAALAGLSLLVAALGILNVMLVAVLARRQEIGLRLAVGAQDVDIGLQFLIESMLLGLAGGVLGLAAGLAAGAAGAAAAGLPWALAPGSAVLAVVLAAGVGAAAGVYPAWQAARLAPVVALRTPA